MISRPTDSIRTFAPNSEERVGEQTPFNGYDYQGFRLNLMDVLSAWAISGVLIALAFALFD